MLNSLKNFKVQKGATQAQIDAVKDEVVSTAKSEGRYLTLPANQFEPDLNQPRKTFDKQALKELQQSIESKGQLQPILVKEKGDSGKYQIIAGERRWRAISDSQVIKNITAIVRAGSADDLLVLLMQLDENNKREQVPALENAEAIKRVVDICKADGYDQAHAASMIGISKGHLSKYLSLLNAPDHIKQLSLNGDTQDVVALYDLARAAKKNEKAVNVLVDQWKSGELEGSLRKASRELAENTSKPSKNKSATAKTPTIKKLNLIEKGGQLQIQIELDKKTVVFNLSEAALKELQSGLKIRQR
ncbi:ParB/RepB/Spo0J family partition protein [Spartinivicinus ruber]|uniref:ParB/RepB/Spo0J family partition protein n=1 Tax=Spartinivicinus ruber TaxID=2683272 RepID=UPI0013CF4C48|nr:ParB/RepB/Spo0J family partition protein [Spartinivicinus ruber]